MASEVLRQARAGHWAQLRETAAELGPMQADLIASSEPDPPRAQLHQLLDIVTEIAGLASERRARLARMLDETRRQERVVKAYLTTLSAT
jgi:hypothetical protein